MTTIVTQLKPRKKCDRFKGNYKRTIMNGLKIIRIKLGLSQQQAAVLLGISRSHVAHYEREMRSIPVDAVTKLASLEIMLANMQQHKGAAANKNEPHPNSIKRYELTKKTFQLHAKYCGLKANKMRRELTGLQTIHEQTIDWLQAIENFIEELSKDAENNIQLLWLQAQHQQALKKLKECDATAQLVMEAKIATLDALKEIHQRMG